MRQNADISYPFQPMASLSLYFAGVTASTATCRSTTSIRRWPGRRKVVGFTQRISFQYLRRRHGRLVASRWIWIAVTCSSSQRGSSCDCLRLRLLLWSLGETGASCSQASTTTTSKASSSSTTTTRSYGETRVTCIGIPARLLVLLGSLDGRGSDEAEHLDWSGDGLTLLSLRGLVLIEMYCRVP